MDYEEICSSQLKDKRYRDLSRLVLYAFFFKTRPKDYGGIHLLIPIDTIVELKKLINELRSIGFGHSRRILLTYIPRKFANRISDRPFTSLENIEISLTEKKVSEFSTTSKSAYVSLAHKDLISFEKALQSLEDGIEDFCLIGDVKKWTDKLWFWLVQ